MFALSFYWVVQHNKILQSITKSQKEIFLAAYGNGFACVWAKGTP